MTDEAVLAFALAEGRAPVTLNRRHFIRLHEAGLAHAGIIACSFDPDFSALAERINAALKENQPIQGKLIRINRQG